jgi:hypothetical protein
VRRVDAGVQQRDRDARPVVAGDARHRPASCLEPELVPLEWLCRGGCRIGDANGVDADDVLVAFEQRERARVEHGGEAVQRPRVDEVRDDLHALLREPRRDLLLACEGGRSPRPHLALGRLPARAPYTFGQRRVAQDDDRPLADGNGGAVAVDESPPRGGAGVDHRRLLRALAAAREEERREGQ